MRSLHRSGVNGSVVERGPPQRREPPPQSDAVAAAPLGAVARLSGRPRMGGCLVPAARAGPAQIWRCCAPPHRQRKPSEARHARVLEAGQGWTPEGGPTTAATATSVLSAPCAGAGWRSPRACEGRLPTQVPPLCYNTETTLRPHAELSPHTAPIRTGRSASRPHRARERRQAHRASRRAPVRQAARRATHAAPGQAVHRLLPARAGEAPC